MKKNYKLNSLISLYISHIFQKGTIIVFLSSLLLMVTFLIIISSPWIENTTYLLSANEIHKSYLEQGIFIIQVFNSIIIALLVLQLFINSNSFDTLFISYVKRKNIVYMKLLSILTILFIIILFEIIILYLIPTLRFSLFKIELENLIIIPYLVLTLLFELSISILLSQIFQSIFMPMSVLFVSIILKAISSINKLKEILSFFIPIIYIDNMNAKIELKTIIVSSIIIVSSLIIQIKIYECKDIK